MNFFDDLNKLNQGTEDNEFSDLNSKVYDEHDYILDEKHNPEFFKALCEFCKHEKIHYNINGFTQKDLNQITYIDSDMFAKSYFQDVTSLDELQYFNNLEILDNYTFSSCQKLKSIILPKNLKEIRNNVFYCCTSLKEIIIPNSVEKIDYNAFQWCTRLKKVIIQNNIKFITTPCFGKCISLEKIVIPKKFKDNINKIFCDTDLSKVDITYI